MLEVLEVVKKVLCQHRIISQVLFVVTHGSNMANYYENQKLIT